MASKTLPAGVLLGPKQISALERAMARRNEPEEKERVILSGQVIDDLTPYVKAALDSGVTKTDLINLALAAYFEVQVYESAQVA